MLDVFEGFGEADVQEVVRESAASAAAAAAASATGYLELSRSLSYDDDDGNTVVLTRFTALNQRATSSPLPTGRTSPGSRSSTPVATSSPSPTRPIGRPRRSVARQSTFMYADVSFEDISTSGDEEYNPNEK